MKRIGKMLFLTAACAALHGVAVAGSVASTDGNAIYREIFPNSATETDSHAEATQQGWYGSQHDNSFSDQRGQIFDRTVGSGSTSPTPNSNPVGVADGTDGRITWTPGARAGVYVYTMEFQFDSTRFITASFDSRNSGSGFDPDHPENDQMHIVMRVLTDTSHDWYVSDQFEYHTAGSDTWQHNEFAAANLTWRLYNTYFMNDPETLPREANPPQRGIALPEGTVTAFGVYNTKNQQGTNRYDDFTLELEPIEDCNENMIPDGDETAPEYDPLQVGAFADECQNAPFIGPHIGYDQTTNGINTFEFRGCGVNFSVYNIWARYRPAWSGQAFISISQQPTPMSVAVYDWCPSNGGVQIGCNAGNSSGVAFHVERGESYYIVFGGVGLQRGNFLATLLGPDALLNENDYDGNGVPDACDCRADVNGDGIVDLLDFLQARRRRGPCPTPFLAAAPTPTCSEDVDGDGFVDDEDLSLILNNLGPCPFLDPTPLRGETGSGKRADQAQPPQNARR